MKWGPWTFNAQTLCLEHDEGNYEISFAECNNCAQILDWIFQIETKTWADSSTLAGLVKAFEAVLHPQENYCGGGQAKIADGAALAQEFANDPGFRERLYSDLGGSFKSSLAHDED